MILQPECDVDVAAAHHRNPMPREAGTRRLGEPNAP